MISQGTIATRAHLGTSQHVIRGICFLGDNPAKSPGGLWLDFLLAGIHRSMDMEPNENNDIVEPSVN